MAELTITIDYVENGVSKTETVQMTIDKDTNQEVYAQWYNLDNGGYSLDGVGGRPNDRKKQ